MELYYGVVRGNRIELETGAHLADGVRVEVRPRSQHEGASTEETHPARDLRVAEDAFKDHLRAAGRLAPVAANGTPDMPTRRRRIQVTGEPLSVQIMRERR